MTLSRAVDEDFVITVTIADNEDVLTGTPAIANIPIAAYETTGTVTLSTTADMMTGADTSVEFTLDKFANDPYILGTPDAATVTVLDDTAASDEITLSVSPATVGEDAGATTLTVTATMNRAALTTPTTVALAVADGTATETTDYTATTANLVIAANARTGTATLTLTPADNTSAAADKTVTVGGTVAGFTVNGAEVTILDDDEPAITLTFPDAHTGTSPTFSVDEDDGTLTITLKAETAGTVAPTRDFDVRLRVVDTPDSSATTETGDFKPFDKTYTFSATDFTLASGQYSHTVSKALEIIDDDTVEKIKKLFVGIDGDTLARHVTPANDALILIDDADTATTRFAQTSYEVDEGDDIYLPITVDAPIASPFAVVVATDELTHIGPDSVPADQRDAFSAELARATRFALSDEDYVQQTTVVKIEAFGTGGFTVRTIEDAIDEGTETLLVTMVGNGLDEDIIIFPKYAFIHIVDDDSAPGAPGLTADRRLQRSDARVDRAGDGRDRDHRGLRLPRERRRRNDVETRLDGRPRQRRGRCERDRLHRDHARGCRARERHDLHVRGPRTERGRARRRSPDDGKGERGLRADEANRRRHRRRGAGERVRGRDGGASGGDYRARQDR